MLTAVDDGFYRLFKGYDSYGNICNMKNELRSSNTSFNGWDTTGLKWIKWSLKLSTIKYAKLIHILNLLARSVLYFNFTDPVRTLKVCVKSCPDRTIFNENDFKNYTLANNITLCFYNVTPGVYDPKLCPKFPIIQS